MTFQVWEDLGRYNLKANSFKCHCAPGSGVRGCSLLLRDGAFSPSARLAYIRRRKP